SYSVKDINDHGQIVGTYTDQHYQQKAFISEIVNGQRVITDLGTLTNGNSSSANAINNNGQVVGYSDVAYPSDHPFSDPDNPDRSFNHAFIAEKSGDSWVMKDLHPETVFRYPKENEYGLNDSFATDINDAAQTVITRYGSSIEQIITIAYKNDTDWSYVTLEDAFDTHSPIHLYDNNNVVINNSGQIAFNYATEPYYIPVGTSVSYSENSWQRTDIPSTAPSDYFFISSINDSDQIVGNQNGFPSIATKVDNEWEVTTLRETGEGNDINDSGVVVGISYPLSSQSSAFIYIDGKAHLLKELIGNELEGWHLDAATNINNSGQIIGNGSYNGKQMAYLLTPNQASIANCEVGLNPQTIKKGEGTALWWWSDGATSATINNGIGDIDLPTNYQWIFPAETKEYVMTVTGTDGLSTFCKAKVIVEGTCEIGADPQVIQKGEGAAIWWWTKDIDTFTVSTNDSNDYLTWTELGNLSGFKWLYPQKTTTYTMNATTKGIVMDGYEDEPEYSLLARGTTTTCETTVIVNE
ncbi:MAG: DUF3466 family protein, partial [Methylococcaceae bacterium]